ncbi:MAG: PKD domain-containing protein, partial [Flavobacteriales bacterium]|nr:PKD domain-containing protein [Flavobacteriales bacterium]
MSRSFSALLAMAIGLSAAAQGGFTCGNNELHRMASLHQDRADRLQEIVDGNAQLEAWTQQYLNDPALRSGSNYVIPVVFHIIHNNGMENISDEQVRDAVRILNEDFNKLNADWDDVNPAFLGIVSDIGIEFRLAQKDPNGDCTNGITRTISALTNDGTQDMKDLIQWPRNRYLNIWVAASADGAAGYTFLPGSVNGQWGAPADGIVILHDYCGSIGTGSPGTSRALTHEVGHWLNLKHTWGGTNQPGVASNCNDDDDVSDTPNTIGWTSCNLNGQSCGGLNNVENYMEYSYCCKMFTEGQKDRMLAALTSTVAQRNQLWTASNLAFTGVSGNDILCAADFVSSAQVVCAGDSITFTDNSYNGVISSDWALPGASPATANGAEVTVQYATPGTYSVSLTATDGQNTVSRTESDYILVLPATGSPAPYVQDFEGVSSLGTNEWFVWDPDGAEGFSLNQGVGYSGTKSIRLRNDVNDDGDKDELISTTYDLTGATDITLTFRYAFARNNADNDDVLRIWVSNNCGQSWSLRKQMKGSTNLPTVPDQGASFTPSSTTQWQQAVVNNIPQSFAVPDFRFKFYFESNGGNNLWIDDINLSGAPVGLAELGDEEVAMRVVPNPASGHADLQLDLREGDRVRISVLNAIGQEVAVLADGPMAAGRHNVAVPVGTLADGLY